MCTCETDSLAKSTSLRCLSMNHQTARGPAAKVFTSDLHAVRTRPLRLRHSRLKVQREMIVACIHSLSAEVVNAQITKILVGSLISAATLPERRLGHLQSVMLYASRQHRPYMSVAERQIVFHPCVLALMCICGLEIPQRQRMCRAEGFGLREGCRQTT